MRFFSPAALGAALGLTLLAAPLAMAQVTDHHSMAHATMAHSMHMPTHHTVSMHRPMAVHMQARHVIIRPHSVQIAHHVAMAPHGDMPHQH